MLLLRSRVSWLHGFFSYLNKVISLKLELAALVDVGQLFVKATYILEGDGLLFYHTLRHYKEFAMQVRMYIYMP